MRKGFSNKKKKEILKKGHLTTFFYLLNREFGHSMDNEEQAADPLAGGIVQQGYQCGMLWGATLALGAESYRRTGNLDKSIGMAMNSTAHVLNSFINRTNTADCSEITNVNWSKKISIFKYMITGKMFTCFKLAEKWAPEVFEAAEVGLSLDQTALPEKPVSCASETVRKMGGSEEEIAIVAGLAGGIGLSGNACGAFAAAIWMNTLKRVREGNYKYTLSDPILANMLKTFYEETGFKMECKNITESSFGTIKNHSEFIKNGGCSKLIDIIASSST